MSGITAMFHRDGQPVNIDVVWSMLRAAPYRGPDGMSVRSFGVGALGHAKLAVTAEDEFDEQPLVSSRTGCTISADVRLDNRDELISQMEIDGRPALSDAEVILRAYEAWNLDALPRLLGDFAFILWDPRQQRLLCARDTSGRRSLFYRVDQTTFAAASEIQQLLHDPAVPLQPNDERIREFLVPLNMSRNEKDSSSTFYEGIKSIEAGCALLVDRANVRIQRYWTFHVPHELRYRTVDAYAEHFRTLFFDVVQARLRSCRPVGVLLSGGLDSSSVACTAQELYRLGRAVDHGFTTFSFVFTGLECDERELIEDVQAKYGFKAVFVECGEIEGWLHPERSGFQASPNSGSSETSDAVFSAATDAGVRALLSGDVADSCIGGSPHVFDTLLRQGQVRTMLRRLRAYRRMSDDPLRTILGLYIAAPLLPLPWQKRLVAAYLQHRFKRDRPKLLPYWLSAEFRAELETRQLAALLGEEHARQFSNPAREMEYRLLQPPELTRHPVPWPIELRQPFADRRLHEFLLAVPPEVKFEPSAQSDDYYPASKQLVRQGLRDILPERVRTRTSKTHFSSLFTSTIERQWTLYEALFGPGSRPEISRRGYVDRDLFWHRLNQLRAGVEGNDFMYLMQTLQLEMWLRGFNQPRELVLALPTPATQSTSAQPFNAHGKRGGAGGSPVEKAGTLTHRLGTSALASCESRALP